MAKKETFEELQERLNKKYNLGVLPEIEVISTNSMGLNIASGVGGISTGRIIRVNGKEGVGKTTLVAEIIASFQRAGKRAAYFDYEYSADVVYLEKLGVNTKDLLFYPESLEDGYDLAIDLMRTDEYGIIVLDSLNAMPPRAILADKYNAGDAVVAVQSRIHSMMLPVIKSIAARHNCCVLGICQYRDNIGAMGYGNDVSKSPGNGWRYFPDIALDIKRLKSSKDVNTFVNTVEFDKNKMAPPFGKGVINYVGGEGIDMAADIIYYGEIAKVISKTGNTYFDGTTKLGVGLPGVRTFLDDNEEYKKELQSRITPLITDNRI